MHRGGVIRELKRRKLTEFQTKVLIATYSIPKGKTMTYKELAKKAGYPNAYRAVGSVMKMNPLAPTIPCHRVVKSDGTLGSYSAPGGTRKKAQLLKKERAKFG
ncbi:MAG: MGMT family protein [Candidatus Micrarchaeales archaeon]|nr:MGMT family protein [Candidatus Micrarchaeales archaeon]